MEGERNIVVGIRLCAHKDSREIGFTGSPRGSAGKFVEMLWVDLLRDFIGFRLLQKRKISTFCHKTVGGRCAFSAQDLWDFCAVSSN